MLDKELADTITQFEEWLDGTNSPNLLKMLATLKEQKPKRPDDFEVLCGKELKALRDNIPTLMAKGDEHAEEWIDEIEGLFVIYKNTQSYICAQRVLPTHLTEWSQIDDATIVSLRQFIKTECTDGALPLAKLKNAQFKALQNAIATQNIDMVASIACHVIFPFVQTYMNNPEAGNLTSTQKTLQTKSALVLLYWMMGARALLLKHIATTPEKQLSPHLFKCQEKFPLMVMLAYRAQVDFRKKSSLDKNIIDAWLSHMNHVINFDKTPGLFKNFMPGITPSKSTPEIQNALDKIQFTIESDTPAFLSGKAMQSATPPSQSAESSKTSAEKRKDKLEKLEKAQKAAEKLAKAEKAAQAPKKKNTPPAETKATNSKDKGKGKAIDEAVITPTHTEEPSSNGFWDTVQSTWETVQSKSEKLLARAARLALKTADQALNAPREITYHKKSPVVVPAQPEATHENTEAGFREQLSLQTAVYEEDAFIFDETQFPPMAKSTSPVAIAGCAPIDPIPTTEMEKSESENATPAKPKLQVDLGTFIPLHFDSIIQHPNLTMPPPPASLLKKVAARTEKPKTDAPPVNWQQIPLPGALLSSVPCYEGWVPTEEFTTHFNGPYDVLRQVYWVHKGKRWVEDHSDLQFFPRMPGSPFKAQYHCQHYVWAVYPDPRFKISVFPVQPMATHAYNQMQLPTNQIENPAPKKTEDKAETKQKVVKNPQASIS